VHLRTRVVVALVSALSALSALGVVRSYATCEWPGVDEAVIGRFVEEAGRARPRPLFDGLRGDALLFAFLCAGLVAGFALGFWGRALFVERAGAPTPNGDRDA
jgi:hypothetical protein